MSAATATRANKADLLRGITAADDLATSCCAEALAACTDAERNEWENRAAIAATEADQLRATLAALPT